MNYTLNRYHALMVLFIGLCAVSFAEEDNFYKWTDEQGIVHYGDHVPPEYSQQERSTVNRYGLTVGVTNAPKTPEQLAEDERKARIQAEEQRRAEEQRTRDRALLNSYVTEGDLEKARDEKISAIESIISATNGNIAMSTQIEESGKLIPESLRKNIMNTQTQIVKYRTYIEERRKDQARIRTQFQSDIERFRELQVQSTAPVDQASNPTETSPPLKNHETDGAVVAVCDTPSRCVQAWSLAQRYVEAKANTRLQVVSSTRIATSEPTVPDAIGISIVRIPNAIGARLVMDIHCHNSPAGTEYCHTPEVQAIRDGFASYVNDH